ncbi:MULTISPECIES: glycosyltransferase family 2 protein [Rubrivivax]|uniref:Glycosyltransferase family 2 protein n=1 Tax=Rubrivivax benzoatilyticus TaxID=316997 RepID=A0ABX0HWP6_9BURK|nr:MULTISPECIES: glycosyltransferase family 2 protein [Rubrivivax]NHK99413.1 glycosyltransferase family 2 protein [Rubrivivax benzoatilyticus]NHL25287.1 glycosyltransferase family 2 protein [Rubrivivax benzoatilyticus]
MERAADSASMKPSVSVVIPAFNCAAFIDQALGSLVAQTFTDWEAFIVDDGSTDDTAMRCAHWCQQDSRLHLLRQENSGGPSGPRNRAIEASSGEFVALLDPDDWWRVEKLEHQLALMHRWPSLGLLFGDSELVQADGHPIGSYFESLSFVDKARPYVAEREPGFFVARPEFLYFTACVYTGIQTSGVMLRRSALESLGQLFPTDLRNCEDNDLWWRVMERHETGFITTALHAYRQHPDGLSHDVPKLTQGRLVAHIRNYQRLQAAMPSAWARRYRQRIAEHYLFLGWQARMRGDAAAARSAYRASLGWRVGVDAPLAILKSWIPPRSARVQPRST